MGYLIANDYLRYIQDLMIQQVISKNPAYQIQLESLAQEKIAEYLSQRFDLNSEFTNTTAYSPTAAYNAGDRVYLDASTYSASATYTQGQLTTAATGSPINGTATNQVYACNTTISTPETFNPAHWTLLGSQYDIFYALYPFPIFDLTGKYYNVGDNVFWKNRTYMALQQSVVLSHSQQLQFYKTGNIPYQNVFPDDPINGPLFWKDNGAYVVPAGNLLTQNPSTYFILTQARDNIFLRGGTQLTVGGNSYTDNSWKGWDWYLERSGIGTLTPGTDFLYTWTANAVLVTSATNPNLLATGFQLIGSTFLLNQSFVAHFQPIISQTAPLNPYSSFTSQQLLTTYFIKGDNRNQSILQHYVALVLFYLYRRIAPKSIPEERYAAYNEAMAWLKMAMKGDIKANMTQIQPPQGRRIRSGSNVKQNNAY